MFSNQFVWFRGGLTLSSEYNVSTSLNLCPKVPAGKQNVRETVRLTGRNGNGPNDANIPDDPRLGQQGFCLSF